MSEPQSRSGSPSNQTPRPSELLTPGTGRHISSASSQGSLGIASYYYNSHNSDTYDFTLDPASQRHRPSWPPTFDSISGSPRERAVDEIAGTSSVLHRRNSSSIRRENERQEDMRSGVRSEFSGWASGLQLGHARGEGSNESAALGPPFSSTDPFSIRGEDTPPQITLSHFSDNDGEVRAIDDDALLADYTHAREESSATEGDVGRFGYAQLPGAAESSATLSMSFGEQPQMADSPPQTPGTPGALGANSMHRMQSQGFNVADESEGAALTSNQTQAGWNRFGERDGIVQSPEEELNSPTDHQHGSYFARMSGATPLRLEDGRSAEDAQSRQIQRSSADVYAQMAAGSGLSRAQTGLNRMGKSLRRISRRVINLEGNDRDGPRSGHIRLADRDDDESSDEEEVIATVLDKPSVQTPFGLRGKSLGIFGPDNPIRTSLFRLMNEVWVEPLILAMIVFSVVLFVIQSAPDVYVSPRKPGYFDYWVDYALLVVFGIFTVELLARIIISGLIINPPSIHESSNGESDVIQAEEAEVEGHRRRKASRSNTMDAFAVMGDSIKSRANDVLKPHETYRRGVPLSPNRSNGPRTVVSDFLDQNANSPPLDAGQHRPEGSTGMDNHKGTVSSISSRLLEKTPFAKAIVAQRAHAAHYAYLRHSWNRIDLVAVLSFWVMFFLALTREEMTSSHHIYVFRALSVLRASRLLTVTSGTSTILQSLKTAGPLLVNVAFFTAFSMLLFSVIGIQAFKGSYRRSCVWVGDLHPDVPGSAGTNYTLSQICGGHYNSSGVALGRVNTDGFSLSTTAKGYICPTGQICVEGEQNPEGGNSSFDNIFESLLQVIIVISSNGWSGTMYDMIDADYFSSCLYFIIGLIVMNFWMANLFVAVITNTFASITAETKQSAFTARNIDMGTKSAQDGEPSAAVQRRQRVANVYKRVWGFTKFFWLALVVADLGVQASQASHSPDADKQRLATTELYITIAFDVEILLRFFSYLLDNDWRSFFARRRNLFDLFLAVITSIMQVPVIKNSAAYAWLTVFQLARFYRVIVAVPRMEALLIRVFGSMSGLFNMILFLLLMVGLACLIAAQLFRGDIPQEDDGGESVEMNFKHIFNSFLAMYQIFSSENWTTILFSALSNEGQYRQAVIAGIFLCGWFLFANFIILQMFIAVIAENFGVAEGQKRAQQLEQYLRKMEKPQPSFAVRTLHNLSPYRWLRERNQAILEGSKGEKGPGMAKRAVDALDEKNKNRRSLHTLVSPSRAQKVLNVFRKVLRLDRPEEQVPLDTLQARQFRQSFSGATLLHGRGASMYDTIGSSKGTEDAAKLFARDRQLTRMRSDLGLSSDDPLPQSEVDANHANRYKDDPRIAQAQLINTHPSYERSLWIFSNTNQFRRLCQSFVPPSYGERLFGRQTQRYRRIVYQALIFSAIAASVAVAGVATPAYRREWYGTYGLRRDSWFSITEVSLSVFFIAEFVVKVIADGFAFTPNAYLMSPWNGLDLFVLLTLVVNVATELAVIGGVSRFSRALKAFRALRLINLSQLMRGAFSALIAGGGRFVDAAVLAILYIVPFAIWGQNLFSGLLYSCNDGSALILTKSDCLGEYSASPSEWSFLAPRVWQNPTQGSTYSFDDFRSSLLILFEIVSLEGWIDVMTAAMSITGRDQQLQTDSRQINALFFVIYNLIGAVFVLTLFVAVIIESFQAFSGAAYLTTAQRQWIDLKRLIARQRPSKRPKVRPQDPLRSWCYDRAVHKHGYWSRAMTFLHVCTLVTLATQQYSDAAWKEHIRDIVFITLSAIFAADIIIRLLGLGWRAFRSNLWNLFDLVVVCGTFATTIPLLSPGPVVSVNVQMQKIFLTAVAFKLVQRSNALNQLFKTAVASLPSIASLFLLWLTMFLVWGIMLVEVFGLTMWGENETYQKNFSTLGGALVFLSMMSTGEGWNAYMHDFTLSPPLCTSAVSYLDTDCGSVSWAYFLFVGWNVISMYIFLNMFTGTVVENFSYVFQLGGKPTLSREEVRNFKRAWASCDVHRRGYLPRDQLVSFLNRLDGALELQMHPRSASLHALREAMMTVPSSTQQSHSPSSPMRNKFTRLKNPIARDGGDKGHFMWPPSPLSSPTEVVMDGLNITRLNKQLSSLDYAEIRRRKHRFERIFTEASLIVEQPANAARGGISFHDMLILLAHYKLIHDEEALGLEELMERRAMQERVEDRIETERVRGMLRLIWLRRRYLAFKAEKMRASAEWQREQQLHLSPGTVPTIHIDDSRAARDGAKPALHLDMRAINSNHGAPVGISPGSMATQRHLSPTRSTHIVTPGNEEHDQTNVNLSSPGDAHDGSSVSLSPSPSMQELERRVSPAIESIDSSAWGALAKRLSGDISPRSEQHDGRGGYGQPSHGTRSRSNSMGGNNAWV